jgi:hypothetical protein
MRFNKRASLEIGVNTIVILVIAMTLLGLGVVFVRNLFTQVGGTVSMIPSDDIASPPTSDKPIKLVPGTVTLKTGKSKEVKVYVYNNDPTEQPFELEFSACTGLDGEKPKIESLESEPLATGDYTGFQTIIYATLDDADETPMVGGNQYICKLIAKGVTDPTVTFSAQFIMDVTA